MEYDADDAGIGGKSGSYTTISEGIDIGLLKDVIHFLTPLKEATKALEGDRYPTIHRICLFYHKLQRNMEPKLGDSPVTA